MDTTRKNEKMNIICLYWVGDFRGRDFSPEDVARLRESVDKHMDRPYEFYCLTNDMYADIPARKIELEYAWPGWWSKMELHRSDLPAGRTLYLDLDTHVIRSLKPILDYEGDLVMFDAMTSPGKRAKADYFFNTKGIVWNYQASVMLFDPGVTSWIYDKFREDPDIYMNIFRSEQDLMGKWIPDQPKFPDEWMVKLATFRTRPDWPIDNTIIISGQPKDVSFRNPKTAPWLAEMAR